MINTHTITGMPKILPFAINVRASLEMLTTELPVIAMVTPSKMYIMDRVTSSGDTCNFTTAKALITPITKLKTAPMANAGNSPIPPWHNNAVTAAPQAILLARDRSMPPLIT